MPVTYLSSLQGGRTTATTSQIPELLKQGWTIDEYQPEQIKEEPKKEIVPREAEKTLALQYEEKFGKPPHHRMSEATIAQHLKE